MPNKASRWAGSASRQRLGNAVQRGYDTARTIFDSPFQIVIERNDVATQTTVYLPPQTVRVDIIQLQRGGGEGAYPLGEVSLQHVIVIGFKNYPGQPDTNIQRADRFWYGGLHWDVIDFLPTFPGRLMVSAEVTP